MKECEVKGCDKPLHSRGWCSTHYSRWYRHGDPLQVTREYFSDPEKAFESRTLPEPNSGCLLWIGEVSPSGYGVIHVQGSKASAHRYAWEQVNGAVPEGLDLDHECHNKLCCNVSHLRIASRSQNMQNRSGPNSNNLSGFRNVVRHGPGWRVRVKKDGEVFNFGTHPTIEEAAQVAEQARRDLFGEFAGRG